ncbi:MAG: biotin carboxylase N-terminal domain-containing protein [Bacteroidota bacterium]
MKKINTILIANRGEIASRIIHTCKKMGIKSIAVFSEVDKNMPYVKQADMAVYIGGSAPKSSYLNQEKIIETAQKNNVDAIHPGYGFLAENSVFAKRCEEKKIIFIGPNISAIDAMGSKSKAKKLMQEHNVPVVPGYQGKEQSVEKLTAEAIKIGFPVLLKATAGGGGKGMRIVREKSEIENAINAAKRESRNAFGDDELIIEKYIASGRHIEFQIFGDQHGNTIHVLERECSIQRRYQKIIEESPSPVMDEVLRAKMGAAAVAAAQAIHYDNAGTVEFIYDEKTKDFYFLEVNTRLQVEHPVTEEITGLDLVELQIEVAQGLPLNISQDEIKGKGYAIEVRLYAEDAANNFLPVTGRIEKFKVPEVAGLRVESAIKSGSEISIFYDPMIAKLIVWDKSRPAAHRKMQYALRNLVCLGMTTNQDFLLRILEKESFQKGIYDTHFIETLEDDLTESHASLAVNFSAMASTLFDWQKREKNRGLLHSLPSCWRSNFYAPQKEVYLTNENEIKIEYRYNDGGFVFFGKESDHHVKLIDASEDFVRVEINGVRYVFNISKKKNNFYIHSESFGNIQLAQKERFPEKEKETIKGGYAAPMPSAVIKILVEKGQSVGAGDGLVVLSSMKMENTIYAGESGVVEEIYVEEGGNVEAGVLLLKIE